MIQMFFLLLFSQSQAFQLSTGFTQDTGGTIQKIIQVSCQEPNLNSCLELCGKNQCQQIEPTCVNCAGSSSELLNILFSRASHFYQSTQLPISRDSLLQLIQANKLVLLDSQSLFNYYTNIRSNESAAEFNSFCPVGTVRSLMAVALDSSGFPSQPVASVCEFEDKRQLMLGIVPRASSPPLDSMLSLKLDTKLN